ncbi:MAG TPA: alpha/beta fold hydrolase [Candidatus Angelobacter sp.]
MPNSLRIARLAFALLCVSIVVCKSPVPGRAEQTTTNSPAAASNSGRTLWLSAAGFRLKTKIYKSSKLSDRPALILVLHGDSPFAPPSYQYVFAREAAGQMDNVIVAALLRPGYADGTGDQSSGVRGATTGDNYTPAVVDAVAQVLDQLKTRYKPAATILVGHSGGAAITGNLLGRWPAAANGALMISCPCDLTAWRKYMDKKRPNPIWRDPVDSLSPVDLAGKISHDAHIRLLVGSQDDVAPPEFTQEFATAARPTGADIKVILAPGLPHDILLEPVAYEQLKLLVATVEKDARR